MFIFSDAPRNLFIEREGGHEPTKLLPGDRIAFQEDKGLAIERDTDKGTVRLWFQFPGEPEHVKRWPIEEPESADLLILDFVRVHKLEIKENNGTGPWVVKSPG